MDSCPPLCPPQIKTGNTLAAWKKIDKFKTEQIDEKEFTKRVGGDLEFKGDTKQVFKYLLAPGKRQLCLDDFDPQAARAKYRGDDDMISQKSSSKEYQRQMVRDVQCSTGYYGSYFLAAASWRGSAWHRIELVTLAGTIGYIRNL